MHDYALIEAHRRHTPSLYRYVSKRVGGDRALAEDIVQETWLRAVDTWPGGGVPRNPAAWLTRVASNLVISHHRKKRPTAVDPHELDLREGTLTAATPDAAGLVNWGLAKLRRRHSEILTAFYFDGMTTREISEAQGISERAVEGRLRRARASLEKRLAPHMKEATRAEPAKVEPRVLIEEQNHA